MGQASLRKLRELITEHPGIMKELFTNHHMEDGEPRVHPVFGAIQFMPDGTEGDLDAATANHVEVAVVYKFLDYDAYISMSGFYSSYGGFYYYGDWEFVVPREVTKMIYEVIKVK